MERYQLNKNGEGYTDNTAMEGIKRADKNKTSKQRVTKGPNTMGQVPRKEILRVKNAYACSE